MKFSFICGWLSFVGPAVGSALFFRAWCGGDVAAVVEQTTVEPASNFKRIQAPSAALLAWSRRGEGTEESPERTATPLTLSGKSSPCDEEPIVGDLNSFLRQTELADVSFGHTAPQVASPCNGKFGLRWEDNVLSERCQNGVGNLHLSSLVAHTETSSVFLIQRGHFNSGLVLKYQSNCDFMDQVHPVVKEYYFLSRVSKIKVAPAPFWISAPAPHPAERSTKIGFEMTEARMRNCHEKGATVRFLVMEETGKGLFTRVGLTSASEALGIGFTLISMLQRMHQETGIAHGDIHSGNVVFWGVKDLRLIDFGRALEVSGELKIVNQPYAYMHHILSPWEMLGYQAGFRDDVFRAIEVVISLVVGDAYFGYLRTLESLKPRQLVWYKSEATVSFHPKFKRFGEIMNQILSVARLATEQPNYVEILRLFSQP